METTNRAGKKQKDHRKYYNVFAPVTLASAVSLVRAGVSYAST